MTTDEKLQHFMDISMQSAMQNKSALLEEFKSGLDIQFEKYKKDAVKTYKIKENTAKESIRRENSKEFANRQQSIKLEFAQRKDELTEKLFEEVTEKLDYFLSTEAYITFLKEHITKAVNFAPTEEIKIFIDPADEDKIPALEAELGVKLTKSAYSFGRGMRAIIPSKNILIDNSFNTRLSDLRDKYSIQN